MFTRGCALESSRLAEGNDGDDDEGLCSLSP